LEISIVCHSTKAAYAEVPFSFDEGPIDFYEGLSLGAKPAKRGLMRILQQILHGFSQAQQQAKKAYRT
jgi:hypothetical protein